MRSASVWFRLEGHQYIAIASGMGGAVGNLADAGAPWMRNYRSGGTLRVFRRFESLNRAPLPASRGAVSKRASAPVISTEDRHFS